MALTFKPTDYFGGEGRSEQFTDNGGYDKLVERANYLASTGSYREFSCNKTPAQLEEGCRYAHLSEEARRLFENGKWF